MTCAGCDLILTPSVQYKCHEGHIFCEYCKGIGRSLFKCLECRQLFGKERRIWNKPLELSTQTFIKEAEALIKRCNECHLSYYNLGNGENQHLVLGCSGYYQANVKANSENNNETA